MNATTVSEKIQDWLWRSWFGRRLERRLMEEVRLRVEGRCVSCHRLSETYRCEACRKG